MRKILNNGFLIYIHGVEVDLAVSVQQGYLFAEMGGFHGMASFYRCKCICFDYTGRRGLSKGTEHKGQVNFSRFAWFFQTMAL